MSHYVVDDSDDDLGLVVVRRRRKRVVTALGMTREAQDTNCYQLVTPPEVDAIRPPVRAVLGRLESL